MVELWHGFDPLSLSLQTRAVRAWADARGCFQELFFAGCQWEGACVDVFAVFGYPRNVNPAPAVLHIHGNGRTADPAVVQWWVASGYAALSFDWSDGDLQTADHGGSRTQWHGQAGQFYDLRNGGRNTRAYRAAALARRAITFLQVQPQVAADRIGVYGESWGGFLTWMVNGVDTRVRAAAPIFGCGGEYWPRSGDPFAEPVWQRNIDPLAYASQQKSPVLFLNSTNDFFGRLDSTTRIMQRTHPPSWLALTANANHRIDGASAQSLCQWMAWRLRGEAAWPDPPEVILSGKAPELTARVIYQTKLAISSIGLYYSLGFARSPGRYWRQLVLAPPFTNGERNVILPVYCLRQPVWVYVTVAYAGGPAMSSVPVCVVPAELDVQYAAHWQRSDALTTLYGADCGWHVGGYYGRVGLLGRGRCGGDAFAVICNHAPYNPTLELTSRLSAKTRWAWALDTFRPADPVWNARQASGLRFFIHAPGATALTVQCAYRRHLADEEVFVWQEQAPLSPGWHRKQLLFSQMQSSAGTALQQPENIEWMEISAASPSGAKPCLADIRWVR